VQDGARRSDACKIIGISTNTHRRWTRQPGGGEDCRQGPKTRPANQLTDKERKKVLETLNSKEYRNLSPKQIVPSLADEGIYLASESTMYRLLRAKGLATHRAASKPPRHSKPREHVATGPEQVLSWDITYLKGPVRGTFFYLYLFIDVWSRKIMGWAVHDCESSEYAAKLFMEIYEANQLPKDAVVLHMDRGSPMKGSTLRATLEQLGVLPSYSRPHVCDDNPYSEALFRTLKYRPEYPTKPFASLDAARAWVEAFVAWYNNEHLHSAIGYVSPEQRHSGAADEILAKRRRVYKAAQRRHPERWRSNTRRWDAPDVVFLNPEDPLNTVTGAVASQRKEAAA
jgi:transposase InsO family protein